MADRSKGVLAVVISVRHRLGWGKEKGGRGSDGFIFGFGWRRVDWSGVEWSGRVNTPRTTMGQNGGKGN